MKSYNVTFKWNLFGRTVKWFYLREVVIFTPVRMCVPAKMSKYRQRNITVNKGKVKNGAIASSFATLEMRRELEKKCVPQLFLGSLLGTRCSVIFLLLANFFPCPKQQSKKSLWKLTRPSFLVSTVASVTPLSFFSDNAFKTKSPAWIRFGRRCMGIW